MRANFQEYIGLTVEEAQAKADESGTPFRVENEDGEQKMLTADVVPYRGNATVENGIVKSMRGG